MNTRPTFTLLVAVAMAAILALPAGAATPSSGTVSESSPSASWTGDPKTPTASATCGGPNNPACDNFALSILPPSYPFEVEITVTPTGGDDYDLEVYDPSGALVGSSGNAPASSELVVLAAPAAGTYTVAVANYAAALPYAGLAEIVEVDPTDPPGSGPTASFSIHQPPGGIGANAGEPSVGVNWNTDRVMTIAGLETLRLEFDDCTSPGAVSWEDVSFTTTGVVTLDPILFTDPITGRTFASQLGPKCSAMAYTDDDGDNWTPSQGCGINAGVDHQSVGGGRFADPLTRDPNGPIYPHAVYYCSQDVAVAQCARSDTGGLTFNEATPIYNITECGGLHGHVKIAPDDGTVYVPNKGCNGEQAVAVSDPDTGLGGNGLPGTWEVRTIPDTTTGEWDPSIGIGSDGTIYVGMTNGGRPMIAVSTDKGFTWSEPYDVGIGEGPNGADILNTAFPVVVAGDGDRAAFGFLGAEQGGAGGGEDPGSPHVWYPYVAVTYDRGETWGTVNLTPGDPVQRGTVCSSGTTCGSSRNLLDFNDIQVDREGRAVFVYADGCIGSCIKQGPNSGSELVTIARQKGGMRLFAAYDATGLPASPAAEAERVDEGGQEIGRITWDEPFDGNSPILGYNVYRRAEFEPQATFFDAVGPEARRYDDATIAAGIGYCYEVTAENAAGESISCGEVCLGDVPPPPPPCPDVLVVDDPLDDTNVAIDASDDPSLDLDAIYANEPYFGGDEKLVVTISVEDLSLPHPSAAWRALWNSPDGGTYFVSMESCDATAGIKCSYGTFDGTLFSSAGEPEGCSFDADGDITITVDKALVGISDATDAGAALTGFEGRVQVFFGALCTGLLGNADSGGPGSYTIETNDKCLDSPDDPIAVGDVAATIEDVPVIVDVVDNDISYNGELTVVAVTAPANGQVANNGDGTVTYAPDAGFTGVDSFDYTIEDEAGKSDSATVTVTVDPACPPEPTGSFSDDFEPAAEPGWNVDTAANNLGPASPTWAVATDAGAQSPTQSYFSDAQTVDLKDDRLLMPPQLLSGASQLTFWHRYGFETTYDGGVLEVSTDGGSTWLDVTAAGGVFTEGGYDGTIDGGFGSPIAGRAAWTTNDTSGGVMSRVTVDLGALGGSEAWLRFRLAADPLAPGAVPGAGWWIDDVSVSALLEPATSCQGAPDAVDDAVSTPYETPVTIDVLANDSDPNGDPLTINGVSQPDNGDVVVNGDDTLTYTPDAGFFGDDDFVYGACDPSGLCDSATVTVTVEAPVNQAPAASDDAATTAQDQAVTIAVLANDSDPDGDPISLDAVGQPANGSAAANPDGTVTYTPDPGFFGTDSFTYEISDDQGATDSATVTVTVNETTGGTGGKVTGGGTISGGRNFGFNAKTKAAGVDGRITYDSGNGGINLRGTADALSIDGAEATFSGPCELDGSTPCTYTAVVEDNGEPGSGVDRFSIQVFDALGQLVHSADELLSGGNIQVH